MQDIVEPPNVDKDFTAFIRSLLYYLKQSCVIDEGAYSLTWQSTEAGPSCTLNWYHDGDEEEECYVGNYADPGIELTWLGEQTVAGTNKQLVKVNGFIMEALGKMVAAWVLGYDEL